jgi:PAS domain S-box-containing protein
VSARLERSLHALAVGLAAYGFLGGVISLAGWVADMPRLTDWDNDGICIQPNTSVGAIAAGVALILLLTGRRRAAGILGCVVALIGGTVLFEHLSGVDLGIDSILMFGRTWGRTGVLVPGRMGPPGSISWTLIGVSLLLASRGPRARAFVTPHALVTLTISVLSLIGYLYGAQIIYTLPQVTIIAWQTSTFIFALSTALLFSVPERAPARWLIEDSTAGTLVRRAVPAIAILPILLGLLRLRGQGAGLYDLEFGTALRTLVEIALLLGLLWWTAESISRQARRTAERERLARASDERLAGILGSMNDIFLTLDAGWRLTFINDEGLRTMGAGRKSLLGRNLWELFPDAVGNEAYVQMHRAMSERVTVEYEVFYGPWKRWFAGKAYPMGEGGLALFARDITERKSIDESLRLSREQAAEDLSAMTRLQSLSTRLVHAGDFQSLLRQILSAAADFTGTGKGSIQLYDPKARRLRMLVHQGFGGTPADEVEEDGSRAISDEAARRLERVILEDIALDPGLMPARAADLLLKDGIRAIQSTPLISRDGRLLGLLNNHFTSPHRPGERELRYLDLLARMTADFLERSRIEQELRESAFRLRERDAERARLLQSERGARRDAERASKIKDEFLATLSHELRSPLNAIIGWVRLLDKRPSDPAMMQEGIAVISRNAKAQADLISDLLDMNRIICGKMRLEVADVILSEVISEAIDAIRPAAESKQLRLESRLEAIEEPIRGDGSRLLQVMWNLLSNAVKFTPTGGTIEVTLARNGPLAEIVIGDTGEGIGAEFLPYIFDRFRQGDASITRAHGGLGLGLAIVKQLVELHGGSVFAESDGEGKGATFSITLPLPAGPPASPDPPPAVVKETGDARADRMGAPIDVDLGGVTVLAVEDQEDARNLVRMVLEHCHARVISARSAEEALLLLGSTRPDVILCDIGMSGKDGYEFIEEVREKGDQTPALALTAFARTEDRMRALRAGYHGHLAKPIEPAELVSTVAVLARSAKGSGSAPMGSGPV